MSGPPRSNHCPIDAGARPVLALNLDPPRRTPTRIADCSGRIVVVHNGIVENYLELKRELTAQGHKFVTQTDTEIIAHLIEQVQQEADAAGQPILLEEAVRRASSGSPEPLRWACSRPPNRTKSSPRASVRRW